MRRSSTLRITAWVAYLQTSVLIGTLALALFNTSKDSIARNLAYAYAGLSVAVLVRRAAFHPFIMPFKHTVVLDLWICGIPA